MSREQIIELLCEITGLVFHSIRDYSEPSDCVCGSHRCPGFSFAHSGRTVAWIRQAVVEKLERDGIPIADGYSAHAVTLCSPPE